MTLILLTPDALLTERIEAGLAVHCPFVQVIGHCYTVEAGIAATASLRPEVVLLDLDMPQVQKQGVLNMLLKAGFRVIALTAREPLYRRLRRQSAEVLRSAPWEPAALAGLLNP